MSTTIYSANYRPSSISFFHDSDGYYHLIYMIVNKINNKIYIGKHTTKNPHDSYMGSGKSLKAAIKKYGEHNFEKVIIDCLSTEDKAYLKEIEIVTPEFIERTDTYNMKCGGKGSRSYDMLGENNPNYGKPAYNRGIPMSNEQKKKISNSKKGHTPPNKGIPMSNEQKKKLSENHWDCSGTKHPMYGKKHSKESIEKMRQSHKGSNNPLSKKVLKIDEYGNVVDEYESLREASRIVNNTKLIRYVHSGKQYKGFFYKYKE